MIDIFLLIICIIFTALSGVVGFYFVITFQHPEDKRSSWFSKIIITIALGVSTMNVLLLPLDAINRSSGNTLKIEIMCWIFTIMSIVLAFAVIPFTMIYYENSEDDDVKHPLVRTCLSIIPFILFLVILFLILWFAVGRCEVPVDIQTAPVVGSIESLNGFCSNCYSKASTWNVTPSAITYAVSLIGFVGYILFLILGGCGLITLPFNMIKTFINRPRPISLTAYATATNALNRWANELITRGGKLKQAVLKNGRNHKSVRKRLVKYENQVDALEHTYSEVQIAYKLRGGNPVWPWVSLFLGIIGIIISIVWIIHIIVYYLLNAHPFLNSFFDALDRAFPYAAVIFFGIFVYYLYWCVLDGASSVGINFLIIRLHPMEKHNTPMTSILFNADIMLFASFGVALFATLNLQIYQRLTSLDMIYGVQMQTLAGLKYIWLYGTYVFFAFILFALVWKLVTLKEKDRKMDIIKNSFRKYDTTGIDPEAKKEKKLKFSNKKAKADKGKDGKKKGKKNKDVEFIPPTDEL